jgi:hypothetical protein
VANWEVPPTRGVTITNKEEYPWNKKHKITALALIVSLIGVSAAMPSAVLAQSCGINVPLNVTQGNLNFVGNLCVRSFTVQNGQLAALGTITGTLTNTATGVVTVVEQAFTALVAIIGTPQATCQILHLELGPIHLTLLGLNIDVSKIVIDVTATAGGGLLGDLLCSIANALNLLDLTTLAKLLTKLLTLI